MKIKQHLSILFIVSLLLLTACGGPANIGVLYDDHGHGIMADGKSLFTLDSLSDDQAEVGTQVSFEEDDKGQLSEGEKLASVKIDINIVDQILGTNENIVLVDVRSPQEYGSGHLPQAVNIPLEDIHTYTQAYPIDQAVIVYCKSGNRSSKAAKTLVDEGLALVMDAGGIKAYEGQVANE